MQILEVKSTTDKDASKKAAQILKIQPDEIEARLHIKGGGGFLGLGSKEPSTYRIFAIQGKTPTEAVITGIIMFVTYKMGYFVTVEEIEKTDEDKLYVTMVSENAGHVIGKRGKTLESLQFIVNLVTQQFTGEPPKILLDIENYRKRRAKYLADMAIRMADAVAKYGKSRLLEPLNPFERRLIHVELQEDDRVETESEGTGIYKRVRIKVRPVPGAEVNTDKMPEEVPADQDEIDEEKILVGSDADHEHEDDDVNSPLEEDVQYADGNSGDHNNP
ncbi:MAG: R3H domain-containing nucleic acid-binding protein [Leptospirales bacterium]